jgi:hypothetical protein
VVELVEIIELSHPLVLLLIQQTLLIPFELLSGLAGLADDKPRPSASWLHPHSKPLRVFRPTFHAVAVT